MLTKADIQWLNHLSNLKKVKITPYNPEVKKVFEKQKKELLEILGHNTEVLHIGATALGISGQGEIDLAIPTSLNHFVKLIEKLKRVYGKPRSFSPDKRARFNYKQDNIDIEIIVVNKDSEGWKRNLAIDKYFKAHPEVLEAYKELKERSHGISIKRYYQRKIEFINSILEKALSEL